MFNGERLKLLREKKKMTQEELGVVFRVSDATINRYEKNQRQPDNDMLDMIADFFEVSTDYLLDRVDDPKNKRVEKSYLPAELAKYVDYIEILKESDVSYITPEELKHAIEFAKKIKGTL